MMISRFYSILVSSAVAFIFLDGCSGSVTASRSGGGQSSQTNVHTHRPLAFQAPPSTYSHPRSRGNVNGSLRLYRTHHSNNLFPLVKQLHIHVQDIIHNNPNDGKFGKTLSQWSRGIPFGSPRRGKIFSLLANADSGDTSGESSDEGTGTSSSNSNGMKKVTTARAGGRSQSQVKRKGSKELKPEAEPEPEPNAFANLAKNALPVVLFLFIVKSLFSSLFGFGGGGSSNYVYYQSTVYESTTYDSNGQTERIRKESVRSNMPGFNPSVEREGFSGPDSSYLRNLNDEIERDLGRVYQDTYRSTIVEDFYD